MNKQELNKIIRAGESQFIEFKANFDNSVIETLVAFSNAKGGKIIIGVSDDYKIIGVKAGKESVQKWINEIKHKKDHQ